MTRRACEWKIKLDVIWENYTTYRKMPYYLISLHSLPRCVNAWCMDASARLNHILASIQVNGESLQRNTYNDEKQMPYSIYIDVWMLKVSYFFLKHYMSTPFVWTILYNYFSTDPALLIVLKLNINFWYGYTTHRIVRCDVLVKLYGNWNQLFISIQEK